MITQQDLINAGYDPEADLDNMIKFANDLMVRGDIRDTKYLLKRIKRNFGTPPPKAILREAPLNFSEAITASSKEEKQNLIKVRKQMSDLLRVPVVKAGAIMPDACPAGPAKANIPVGGAIAVENAIIPSAHSADICCSMLATFYEERSDVGNELDALTLATRFGPGHRHLDDLVHHPVLDLDVWSNPFLNGLKERAHAHIADQGDGNHFAFIGKVTVDKEMRDNLRNAGYEELAASLPEKQLRVLVTHHGSRGLGAHVYRRGQSAALKHTARIGDRIPPAAAWLDFDSDQGRAYWQALDYISLWTRANHESIHQRFLRNIGGTELANIGNEHNFVWKHGNTFLHGKGATPAWKDDLGRPKLGLIPLNMAQPILLVLGSDNANYLSFAPHGAGRNLSRTALKRQFLDEATRKNVLSHHTKGLDIRWYCGKPDISESPVAYKDAEAIKSQISEFNLAEIVTEIHPLGCIMAGDSGKPWLSDNEHLTPKQKRQIKHRADRRREKQFLAQGDFDEPNL